MSNNKSDKQPTKPQLKYPTLEQIEEVIHGDEYLGWCLNCGEFTHDSCEPDARKYECPECGKHTCYGAEELVIMGLVK